MANKNKNKKKEESEKGLNLSGLLTLASLSPQFSTFSGTAEASYEVLDEVKEDLLQFFDDEDELDSLIADIKDLALAADTIGNELEDAIERTLVRLQKKNEESE